jgi:hypothetical protein
MNSPRYRTNDPYLASFLCFRSAPLRTIMPAEAKGELVVVEKQFDYSPLDAKVAEKVRIAADRNGPSPAPSFIRSPPARAAQQRSQYHARASEINTVNVPLPVEDDNALAT